MSIKKIHFDVTANGITPATRQRVGVQGEHNVTHLEFELSNELFVKLQDEVGLNILSYRFDAFDSSGCVKRTVPQTLDTNTVLFKIENDISINGGNVEVYLIITSTSDNGTEFELISFPALLNFKNTPESSVETEGPYESLSALEVSAGMSAKSAEENKNIVVDAAGRVTAYARALLEDGNEYVFDGGTPAGQANLTFKIVVDDKLIDGSDNPVANRVISPILKELQDAKKESFPILTELQNVTNAHKKDIVNLNTEVVKIKESDYVVEQGTTDTFMYRKYKSGICELWGRLTLNNTISPSGNIDNRCLRRWFSLSGFNFKSEPFGIACLMNGERSGVAQIINSVSCSFISGYTEGFVSAIATNGGIKENDFVNVTVHIVGQT